MGRPLALARHWWQQLSDSGPDFCTRQTVQLDPQTEEEMRLLREQVDVLRAELQRAEGELDDRVCWAAPPELQHWLQLTYEVEQRGYNKKRLQAEKQLEQAKEAVSFFLFPFFSKANLFLAYYEHRSPKKKHFTLQTWLTMPTF